MSNRPACLHIPERRLVTGFPKEEASLSDVLPIRVPAYYEPKGSGSSVAQSTERRLSASQSDTSRHLVPLCVSCSTLPGCELCHAAM